MQLKQFSSGAEVIANYKAVRERVSNWRPPPPPPTRAFVYIVDPCLVNLELFVPPPALENSRPTTVSIQKAICRHYDVTSGELISARRDKKICWARQIAMWLCSKLISNNSLPRIGRSFGGRDHTTVLHAIRKIDRLLATDSQLAEEIAALRKTIEGA